MNSLYQSFFRKILFKLDPELAHDLTCGILGYAETIPIIKKIISQFLRVESKNISLFGLNFSNCVGLAAGLDKNGMFPGISSSLGFGHIEVGTVTPLPQQLPSAAALSKEMRARTRAKNTTEIYIYV